MADFIQEQLLKMTGLNQLIGKLLTWIGIDTSGRIGGSLQFFLFDVIKITILLCQSGCCQTDEGALWD